MENKEIAFLGIETQVEPTQSPDGLCDKIKNLVPFGYIKEAPLWKPIQTGDNKAKDYPMSIAQDLPNPDDSTVLASYWHERKYKEQGATKTDTSRWLLLIRDTSDETVSLFATQVVSNVHRLEVAALCTFDYDLWQTDYKFKWQRINAQDVALNVYNDDESHIFYIIGDNVYNNHIFQKHNQWIVDTETGSYAAADYPNGGYPGYLAAADKYFGLMLVWRIETTGTFIKHTTPKIVKIDQTSNTVFWPIIVKDSSSYIDGATYTDRLLLNNEKQDEIKGPYLALTVGYGSREDAFQTGSYYVVGLLDSFEKNADNYFIGQVAEDNITTFPILNIDPLSHHILTGRRIGNYRNNLTLGDVITNFHLPAAEWWFTEPLTDPTLATVLKSEDYNDIFNNWTFNNVSKSITTDNSVLVQASTSGAYAQTTVTPANTTDDLVIEIEYDNTTASDLGATLDVTGAGIVDSTGNAMDFVGNNTPGEKETVRVTIPGADISTTGTVTIKVNLTYTSPGNRTLIELFSIRVTQRNMTLATTYDIAEVTIPTDQGEFKRYQKVLFYDDATDILLPETLSYPDRRASQIKLWRLDSSTWYNYYTKNLKAHPVLNLAYDTEESRTTPLASVTSSSETTSDPFTYTGQNTHNRRPEIIRAANLNEYDWPLERTYSVKSPVVGFVDNTQETGDGQFAQFPLIILCERSIHGAESTAEIFISRIETITDDYGVHSENAFAVFKNMLWFCSQSGIHILQGNEVVDIYYGLRKYDDEEDFMSVFLGSDVYVGVHEPTKEVIFTDGATYTLVWNTEFSRWYEGSVTLGDETTGRIIPVNGKAHFMRLDGGNDSGTFTNDFMATWRDGSDVVDVELTTNEITMGVYTVMKRLFRAILIGKIKTDGSGSGLNVKIQGKKSVNDDWVNVIDYTFTSSTDLLNLFMRSNYGSFQTYRCVITGPMEAGAYLQSLQIEFERRGGLTK